MSRNPARKYRTVRIHLIHTSDFTEKLAVTQSSVIRDAFTIKDRGNELRVQVLHASYKPALRISRDRCNGRSQRKSEDIIRESIMQ